MRRLILVNRQSVQSGSPDSLEAIRYLKDLSASPATGGKLGDGWPGLRPLQLASQRSRHTQLSRTLQLPLVSSKSPISSQQGIEKAVLRGSPTPKHEDRAPGSWAPGCNSRLEIGCTIARSTPLGTPIFNRLKPVFPLSVQIADRVRKTE